MCQHFVCALLDIALRPIPHHQHEFIPGGPNQGVVVRGSGPDPLRDLGQHPITELISVGVVDGPQTVDVHHDHPETHPPI